MQEDVDVADVAKLRLHLGCGQRYLKGYLNIDFPLDSHTVQETSVADQLVDITTLSYPASSVTEVRLHHVFEHFSRPIAAAQLVAWNSWMPEGGRLHIEVPDMFRTGLAALNPFSASRRAVAERHLFGSQEAPWAVHYRGYTPNSLRHMLRVFGFRPESLRRNSWRGTYNIELIASKTSGFSNRKASRDAARNYLKEYLVDESPSELRLLETWLAMFDAQVARGAASDLPDNEVSDIIEVAGIRTTRS